MDEEIMIKPVNRKCPKHGLVTPDGVTTLTAPWLEKPVELCTQCYFHFLMDTIPALEVVEVKQEEEV
jgi:hypothetical protein